MVDKDNITEEWIISVSKKHKNADKILIEKVIRAMTLLEGLCSSDLQFVFKGGTSLMLLFNSSKRLSIDIDIIMSSKAKNLDEILSNLCLRQGFLRVELQERPANSIVEKSHYKFFYTPAYKSGKQEDYILLDILFEEIPYSKIIQRTISSSFMPMKEPLTNVSIPCAEDLLGDKLTAFAPNTTGIPYFKHDDSMSMEIIKQLYDVGCLFDVCEDMDIVRSAFLKIAEVELGYKDNQNTIKDVLHDIFNTALCISTRGQLGEGKFVELQSGVERVKGFIYSDKYHIEKAIVSSAKAAYLSMLIKSQSKNIERFSSTIQVKDFQIENPLYNKLNKLKKQNAEAFFYWYKALMLI